MYNRFREGSTILTIWPSPIWPSATDSSYHRRMTGLRLSPHVPSLRLEALAELHHRDSWPYPALDPTPHLPMALGRPADLLVIISRESHEPQPSRGNDHIPSGQPKPLETQLKKTHEAWDQKLNDCLPLTYSLDTQTRGAKRLMRRSASSTWTGHSRLLPQVRFIWFR